MINIINLNRSKGKSNPYISICSQNAGPSAQTPLIINNKFIIFIIKIIIINKII
jgi:hypothetical protein